MAVTIDPRTGQEVASGGSIPIDMRGFGSQSMMGAPSGWTQDPNQQLTQEAYLPGMDPRRFNYLDAQGNPVGYRQNDKYYDMSGNAVQGMPQQTPTANPAPFSQATPTTINGPSMNPFTQTESQAGVADYAMPYVTSLLGATQSQLFNIDPSGNITGLKGYTPYSQNAADYFAGFTPLQQQAQQGVANLSLPSTFGQAIGLTGQTYGNLMGLGGMAGMAGRNYAMQATNPYAISSYMNPYLMNSLAPQMQLLGQQQAQQANQLAGQATQAGAFGGSRYGIQKGLQDQANQLAMSNLVGQGYNQAYNQALQNMQFGANLGLQGQQAAAGMYGQGLNAANQLSNLGNQALQAQQGILNAQQQTGATQQGLQQQILNQAVQNYNTAYQYPYQQLGFMQNMLQGLPFATQSQQYYQQAPTTAQNLAALGMGAYGLNSLLGGGSSGSGGSGGGGLTGLLNSAGSGLQSGYNWLTGQGSSSGGGLPGLLKGLGFAEGGSVESPGNIESIVSKLSDGQLQQAAQAASARGDVQQLQAIQEEMATRASERGGLAGAFNQLPAQTRTAFARGGMVAFVNNDEQPVSEDMPATRYPGMTQYEGQGGTLLDPKSKYYGMSIPEFARAASSDVGDFLGGIFKSEKENVANMPLAKKERERRERLEADRAAAMAQVNAPQGQNLRPTPADPRALYGEKYAGPTPVDETIYSNQDLQNMVAQQTGKGAGPQGGQGPRTAPVARPGASNQVVPQMVQAAPSSLSQYNQLIADLNKPAPARQDRASAIRENMALRREMLGENPADALAESLIKQQDAERINALNQGRGLAALSAMSGMLQPGGFMRGLGAAGGQFANAYQKTLAEDRAARSNLMQAQIHLADSKYKAKVGDYDSARQDYKDYEDRMDKADANDKARKMGIADILHKIETEKNQRAQVSATAAHYAQDPVVIRTAEALMKRNPELTFDKALDKAIYLNGGYRTEATMNVNLQKALDKINERGKIVSALGNTPLGQKMQADLENQRQEAYRLYGQPGMSPAPSAAPSSGFEVVGKRPG